MKRVRIPALAGVLLLAAGSGYAITVSGLNPNSSSYLADEGAFSGNYSSGDYSGVVELLIVRSDLGYGVVEGCSGVLLADGVSILTSAQCLADSNGQEQATAAYVTFTTASGSFTMQASKFNVDPAYNGSSSSASDIAVLTLATPAPADAARYDLYTGDSSDQSIMLAGYGFGGTGITGYDPIDYPMGTLRIGENQYVVESESGDLMFDFTADGLPDEAFIAPGDTGGPSFIDGEIAGIHTYVGLMDGVSGIINSSFGEIGFDVSADENLAFIEAAMLPAPEPNLMFILGLALVAVALTGHKRRQG